MQALETDKLTLLSDAPGVHADTGMCLRLPTQVVDDPSGNKKLLVMEYMEGGPVMTREALERGRCVPEPLAMQYFRDMCKVHPHSCSSLAVLCSYIRRERPPADIKSLLPRARAGCRDTTTDMQM